MAVKYDKNFFLKSIQESRFANDPKRLLYKGVIGMDQKVKSPTLFLSNSTKKSVEHQLFRKLENYSKSILKFKDPFLKGFSNFLSQNTENIIKKIKGISSDPPLFAYIVSFSFEIEDEFFYPIDVPQIMDVFLHLNKGKNGKKITCSVCGKVATSSGKRLSDIEVFKFSTMEKLGFIPGMNKNNVDKIVPICEECYAKMQLGSNIITQKLDFKFYYKDHVWIIPKSLSSSDESIKSVIKILSNDNSASLDKDVMKRRSVFENRILGKTTELSDLVQLDFFFYRPNSSQRKIVLHVTDVPPTFLKEIGDQFKFITKKYKSIAGDWFEYSLNSIYDVVIDNFQNPNTKDFYSFVESLLEKKNISEKLLISHAMHKMRSVLYGPKFKKDDEVFHFSTLVYEIMATIDLFKKLTGKHEGRKFTVEMLSMEEKELDAKVNAFLGNTLDTTEKKAYFYLGVLTGRLLDCQKKKTTSGKAPFYDQLKGLRMKEKDFKSLYAKLINKMTEYSNGDNDCFFDTKTTNVLKRICAYTLASTKKWELGTDEANFIFTTGMVLNFSEPLRTVKGDN